MQVQSLLITLCLFSCSFLLNAQPQATLNQAAALTQKGAYQASNELLHSFIDNYPEREYDLGEAYYQKSLNDYGLGQFRRAQEANSRSIQIRLPFGAEDLGKNYLHDGRINLDMLRLPEALASLKLADQFPFIDDPLLPAEAQRVTARVYVAAGKTALALHHYEKALGILAVLAGEEDPAYQKIILDKARTQLTSAPDSAKALLTTLLEQSPSATHFQALGDYYRHQHDWAAATGQYQQAYTRTASNDHLRKAELLLRLGQLALQQGQPATDYARQSIERLCPGLELETITDRLPNGQTVLDTPLLVQAFQLKAEQHMRNCGAQQREEELKLATAAARIGISLFEQQCGHYGLQALRKRQALPLLDVFSPLLHALSVQGNAPEAFLTADRAVQWHWYLEGMQETVTEADLKALQKGLQAEQALLTYHVGTQQVIAVAMSAESTATAVIPLAAVENMPLAAATAQFRRAIAEADGEAFSRLGYDLYERLVSPLEEVVGGKTHLQIYRGGLLQDLPFEALLVEAPKKRQRSKYHKMNFLGEAVAISYSSRPAQAMKDSKLQLSEGLVVAPEFDGEAGSLDATERIVATLWTPDIVNDEGQIVSNAEAVTINGVANSLKGIEATTTKVMEALAPYPSVLIAAPFVERKDTPAKSAFLLAQEPGKDKDGIWRLEEWGDWLQSKGLVVMGAPQLAVTHTAHLAQARAVLFAEADRQELLRQLAEDYAALPLAQAAQAVRKARAKKRRTASPQYWLGLWVFAP